MGYRIELEEIEAALSTIPDVKECAVVYQKLGDGMGQILGFVASDKKADSEQLIAQVAAIVPPYMVPKRIEVVEDLPKNANGKIDRQALLKMKNS
jgi:D-alanine--poly(phosphoribitol) ligase subunit 1